MYEELIRRLNKYSAEHENHGGITAEAADAIEKLIKLNAEITKRELKQRMSKPRWIPVTERLPDMHVEVLVCTEGYGKTELGFSIVAVFDGTGWRETWERREYLAAVTHWMPLPEPPKEEKHDRSGHLQT